MIGRTFIVLPISSFHRFKIYSAAYTKSTWTTLRVPTILPKNDGKFSRGIVGQFG